MSDKYKQPPMGDFPRWLRNGPVWSNVRVDATYGSVERIVVWYRDHKYLDSSGCWWTHAEPIKQWQPEPHEGVVFWHESWLDDSNVKGDAFRAIPTTIKGRPGWHIAKWPSDGSDLRVGTMRAMEIEEWSP